MKHEEFVEIFNTQVKECEATLVSKGLEYATNDRLHNFKVAARLQHTTCRGALGGMLAKHVVSIFDLVYAGPCASQEVWQEKIGDAMNYLFLLRAIVEEELMENNDYNSGA